MIEWLDAADVDVLALQEVRATAEELRGAIPGWEFVNDEALAKGRAGVAIGTRTPPASTAPPDAASAGSMSAAASTARSTDPTPGGPCAAMPSTTTRAGASI